MGETFTMDDLFDGAVFPLLLGDRLLPWRLEPPPCLTCRRQAGLDPVDWRTTTNAKRIFANTPDVG